MYVLFSLPRLVLHALASATFLAAVVVGHVSAQTEQPTLSPGFSHLVESAPDVVGTPLEAERPGDEDGSTVVRTSTGLLYWQSGVGPSWTDGYNRLTLDLADAVKRWVGQTLKPPVPVPDVSGFGVWDAIKSCETRDLGWNANTGNGFYGGLQFDAGSWITAGGGKYAPRADLAAPWQQVEIANHWLAQTSWKSWPWCSLHLGLRR